MKRACKIGKGQSRSEQQRMALSGAQRGKPTLVIVLFRSAGTGASRVPETTRQWHSLRPRGYKSAAFS